MAKGDASSARSRSAKAAGGARGARTSGGARGASGAGVPDAGKGTRGGAAYLAIGAFALLYLVAILLWRLPAWPGMLYAGASVLCFIFYAVDKSAAKAGRWRTPESTLLLLGLCCGWPGAILAQQWLRHKSGKTSFQLAFWATVAVNMAAFGWLAQLQA
ncbi:DUF1294 domain-containing protein [Pseudoduganella sp. LjRoot289]|uniref:DUF1294 domain-containing protein n=1 Tax=Pseudoduganella sp. LjRoot289 TaxID=3342314 RepID=UPI003F5055E4